MPKFPDDSSYQNGQRIADEQGLIWDGHYGSPYGTDNLWGEKIKDDINDTFGFLFDHTKRFKPRGAGARKPVLAISSPYGDVDRLREGAEEFARIHGLNVLVGDERFRVYRVESTTPIVFWRGDLHTLK